ncbi:hypothetical protein RchiOBHm_Chr4g0397121 [Rosa chinensis]|uniref:Uncharacterized protein n=1 Tax=Rosa chinensis TaxID=74649 RepID=A0A2P6QRY0_ROSCH|nr:hypothetical protein RchiOBHm_Chr4g0397121 [Rosa chinensis]
MHQHRGSNGGVWINEEAEINDVLIAFGRMQVGCKYDTLKFHMHSALICNFSSYYICKVLANKHVHIYLCYLFTYYFLL